MTSSTGTIDARGESCRSSGLQPRRNYVNVLSARSGSTFGNGQVLVMRTVEDPANPLGQLVSSQQPLGLDHFPLAVYPLGFYGVEPRTLLGQKATHDPHSLSTLLDFPVMLSEPAPDLPGDMPTGVVPDEDHGLLARCLELFAAPPEELRGYGTHRPTVHEPYPRLVDLGQVEPVAGDGLRLLRSSLATD